MNMFFTNLKYTISVGFKSIKKKLRKAPTLVFEADVDVRLRFPETISMFYTMPHGAAIMRFYSDGSCSAVMRNGDGTWSCERKDETFRWEYSERDTPAIAFGVTHLAVCVTESQFNDVVSWLKLHQIKEW